MKETFTLSTSSDGLEMNSKNERFVLKTIRNLSSQLPKLRLRIALSIVSNQCRNHLFLDCSQFYQTCYLSMKMKKDRQRKNFLCITNGMMSLFCYLGTQNSGTHLDTVLCSEDKKCRSKTRNVKEKERLENPSGLFCDRNTEEREEAKEEERL